MENKEPTYAQIKKFWEWCGFRYEGDRYWIFPDGSRNFRHWVDLWELPIDLNNLFKYAVPKILPEHDFAIYWVLDVDAPKGAWAVSMSAGENRTNIRLHHSDPALALFWAIWEIKDK